MKLTDDIADAIIKWGNGCDSSMSPEEKFLRLHAAISELIRPIETKLIDWIESLGYACNDVDLTPGDEESNEQVAETYQELRAFLNEQGIDWIAELKRRGALAE